MAIAKMKKSTMILVKICTQGFLGLLIMNPLSDFHNSKWRIRDGDRKNEKKYDDIGKNMHSGIFGVADNKSVIRFS